MTVWPIHWRKNQGPARMDIGERYLAHLRWDLMNMAPPHISQEFEGEQRHSVEEVLEGRVRLEGSLTMIGENRLVHLQTVIKDILQHDVPGDILEAGAWKGGACIYMRACLDVFGCRNKIVYACDAYDLGFPAPDPKYTVDGQSKLHLREYFKTSNVMVREYCARYGYDDGQIQIVPGYFKDTLPTLPIAKLALLRLDGDLYGSNMEPLELLYDKVAPLGYVIVDDYFVIVNAQMAVDDFRTAHRITAPLKRWDWASAYWQKEAA
jgi:O-methyltransferase